MSYSTLGIVIIALDIFAIFSLIEGTGSKAHKALWITLILLLPVVGMVMFFLLGRNPARA